ncbi:TPA: hypothetical protein DDZ86_04150 [Candidatus Dependentiae bacterium]|nr:hypothetical protein [Candidatus Dependentiae bacterium]
MITFNRTFLKITLLTISLGTSPFEIMQAKPTKIVPTPDNLPGAVLDLQTRLMILEQLPLTQPDVQGAIIELKSRLQGLEKMVFNQISKTGSKNQIETLEKRITALEQKS